MVSSFILPIATLVFAVFFLVLSLRLPESPVGIGAGGWPTAILVMMLLLGSALLVKTAREEKRKKDPEPAAQDCGAEEAMAKGEAYPYRHWVVVGILVLYFFLMQHLGTVLTTPFFVLVLARLLGMRNWFHMIIISLLFTALIIFLFIHIFSLSLPQGTGIFRNFNLIFY